MVRNLDPSPAPASSGPAAPVRAPSAGRPVPVVLRLFIPCLQAPPSRVCTGDLIDAGDLEGLTGRLAGGCLVTAYRQRLALSPAYVHGLRR